MGIVTDKGYLEDGLSDDGKTFTKLVEMDDEGIGQDDGGDDTGEMGFDEMLNVDVNSLPEEHRDMFVKMREKLSGSVAELNAIRGKADTTEKIALELARRRDTGTPPAETKPKKLAESLKFEENDYYAPFFKALAGALDNITEQISSEKVNAVRSQQTTIQTNAKKYIAENKLTPTIVSKMDEIAGEFGTHLYQDLPRLHKLARVELGLPSSTKPSNQPVIRKPSNRTIESGNFRKAQGEPKKVATMKDAFIQAEEALSKQD